MQLSPELAQDWWCGAPPASGAVVDAQLAIHLWPSALPAACTGPDLACDAIALPELDATLPVQVGF